MNKTFASLISVIALVSATVVATAPAQAVAARTLPAGDKIYVFGCTVNGSNPPGVGNLADDGTVTELAAFPSAPDANGHCFLGPAYDPTSGLIYALDLRRSPTVMWVFDPATNSFSPSETADVSACKPANLAIDKDGNAYALTASNAPNPNSLVTIDLATGTCSAPIGSAFTTSIDPSFGGFGGFAFNLLDNVLYATDYSTGRFISIGTADGSVTDFPNSAFGAGASYGSVGFDSTGMTWIAYGDYAQSLQSAPWASYTADFAVQGYYDFNGGVIYADAIAVVPGDGQPDPSPAVLPTTGLSESSLVGAGAIAIFFSVIGAFGLVTARRKRS